jgi:hypothetical protein
MFNHLSVLDFQFYVKLLVDKVENETKEISNKQLLAMMKK